MTIGSMAATTSAATDTAISSSEAASRSVSAFVLLVRFWFWFLLLLDAAARLLDAPRAFWWVAFSAAWKASALAGSLAGRASPNWPV